MDDGEHHYDFEQESRNQVYIGDGISGIVAVAFMAFCGVIYSIFSLFRRH